MSTPHRSSKASTNASVAPCASSTVNDCLVTPTPPAVTYVPFGGWNRGAPKLKTDSRGFFGYWIVLRRCEGPRTCLVGGAKPTTQTHAARSCAALMLQSGRVRRAAIAVQLVTRQLQRQRRSQRACSLWRRERGAPALLQLALAAGRDAICHCSSCTAAASFLSVAPQRT